MKKRSYGKGIFIVLVVLIGTLAMIACGKVTPISVLSVTLNKTELNLKVGSSENLTAAVAPDNAEGKEITWASDNIKVATVSTDGLVVAVKQGKAVISASTVNGVSGFCQVTVTNAVASDEIKVDGYLYHEDFTARTSMPSYLTTTNANGGVATVVNGALSLTTDATASCSAFVSYVLPEVLADTIEIEMSVSVASTSFSNIMYLYATNSNDPIVSLAMNAGNFTNHNGSSAVNIAAYAKDTWYNLKMIMNMGSGSYNLYIDDVLYSNLPFRKLGDGLQDSINQFKVGTDKISSAMYYQFIKIKQAGLPILEVTSNREVAIDLDNGTEKDYLFEYTVIGNPTPTTAITCDKSTGWAFDADNANKVIFNGGGVYTFTVSSTNIYGTTSAKVVISVNSNSIAPEIIASKTSYVVALDRSNVVELEYSLEGTPLPESNLACDVTSGYTIASDNKTITFDANATQSVGKYNFTLTSTNSVGSVSKIFVVQVKEFYDVIFQSDFATMPQSLTPIVTGVGTAGVEDGALRMKTGSTTSTALVRYDFDEKLSGKVLVDMTVQNNSISTSASRFINLLYLYETGVLTDATAGCAISIGIDNDNLKSHRGGSDWGTSLKVLEKNAWYNIQIIIDFDLLKIDIYVGNIKVGNQLPFRNPAKGDNVGVMYLGTTKNDCDVIYDKLTIKSAASPIVEATEVADFDVSEGSYTLDYTVKSSLGSQYAKSITCDKTTGVILTGDVATFTINGTYIFTVNITDILGSGSVSITVNVTGGFVAPTISTSENAANLYRNISTTYTLVYVIESSLGNDYTTDIICDQETGFTRDGNLITFATNGVYKFTITVTDIAGSSYVDITITVMDSADAPVISISESTANVDVAANNTYVLNYTVNSTFGDEYIISVTCDKLKGYSLNADNKTISFAINGTYKFTITVTDNAGNGHVVISISVIGGLNYATVTSSETNANVDRDISNEYILKYIMTSSFVDYSLTVVIDQASGFTLDDNKFNVVFTANGTYTFTITVTDELGTASVEIIVEVSGNPVAPSLTLDFDATNAIEIDITTIYIVDYTVSGTPAPIVNLTCDQPAGWNYNSANKTLTFSKFGAYQFTLSATSYVSVASESFTINVNTDKYSATNMADSIVLVDDTTERNFKTISESQTVQFGAREAGLTVTEVTFTNNSNATSANFANILFLYDGTTPVTTFAIENGTLKIKYSTGNWTNMLFNGNAVIPTVGTSYTIKVVSNSYSSLTYVYLSGGEFDSGVYLGEHAFRGVDTIPSSLQMGFGSDKLSTDFTITAVRIYRLTPSITVVESTKSIINFVDTAEYDLNFEASANATETTITCPDTNCIIADKKVTFAAAGVYVFTIISTNSFGATTANITVTVLVPQLGLVLESSESSQVKINDGVYVLIYSVLEQGATFELTSNVGTINIDYTYNQTTGIMIFATANNYTFTLKGTSGELTQSITFSIKATNDIADQTVLYQSDYSLDATNPNWKITQNNATVTQDGNLNFTANSSGTIGAFADWKFDEKLTGVVTSEVTFIINSNKFTNIMFLTDSTSKNNAVCFAIEGYRIRYYSSGWKDAQLGVTSIYLINGEQYTLKSINDFTSQKSYLYITGANYFGAAATTAGTEIVLGTDIYLGEFAFRATNIDTTVFRIGTDKASASFIVKSAKVYGSALPQIIVPKSEIAVTGFVDTTMVKLFTTILDADVVDIVCDNAINVAINNNDATITAIGTYTFTITSKNNAGKVVETIVVTIAA